MRIGMRAGQLGAAAGILLWGAGIGLACSVGADPGVNMVAHGSDSGGNAIVAQQGIPGNCNLGIWTIDVYEGDSVGLEAAPINRQDATGCTVTGSWANLVTSSGDGGDLTLASVFGPNPEDLFSFVASGIPGSDFYFTVTQPAGAGFTPTGCNQSAPPDCADKLEELAINLNANLQGALAGTNPGSGNSGTSSQPPGTWEVVGASGPPTGGLSIDANNVKVLWRKRVMSDDLPAAYQPYGQKRRLGYNPDPESTIGNTSTDGLLGSPQITMKFDTPSFSGEDWPGLEDNRYAIFAEALLPWTFNNATVPLLVQETTQVACNDPSGSPPADDPDCSDTNGDGNVDSGDTKVVYGATQPLTITLNGTVLKAAKPGDGEGHPTIALVGVRDKTQPIAAETDPLDTLGVTKAGRPLAFDSNSVNEVSVRLWDNNPHATADQYEAEAWYLVERSNWEGGYEGLGGALAGQQAGYPDADTTHELEADDSWAANPGHVFQWVHLGSVTADSVTQLTYPEAGEDVPIAVEVNFPPFVIDEPTGIHFVDGADGDSNHMPFTDKGLKFVYKVREPALSAAGVDPERPPGGVIPEDGPPLDIAEDWGGIVTANFQTGGGNIPPPVNVDTDVDPIIISNFATDDQLRGAPTWNVEDDLRPSVVLIAKDLKYERIYYFGEPHRAGATCSGGTGCDSGYNTKWVNAAYVGGGTDGGDPLVDLNMNILPLAGGDAQVLFDGNDGQDGYTTQINGYVGGGAGDFLPALSTRAALEHPGLWIDEDTRVEFFVTAWDNVNGHMIQTESGGLKHSRDVDVTFELVDEPSGADPMTAPGIHLFRNPNRDANGDDNNLGEAYVIVTATDKASNRTEFRVNIYIADNQLRIYSLEESRRRLSN